MEGLTLEEVRSLDPPVLFIEVGNDAHSVNPKDGEPFEDVWERAKRFARLIFREYKGSRVLVVSHGVFLQMLHGVLRGSNCIESLSEYPANLGLATFRFSGRRLVAEERMNLIAPTGQGF
jgi:broad specificity phosphatase PhoE